MEFDEQALQKVREDRLLINGYDRWLLEKVDAYLGQRVLDIGCGMGNLANYLQNRTQYVGIDTCEECVQNLQKMFIGRSNMVFRFADVTAPGFLEFTRYKLDTGISVNVFEHIENDELALHNVRQVLIPGARLIMIVPAHQALYGDMDRAIGHYRRYTKQSMAEKMEKAGYEVLQQRYVNLIGALGWYLNGRILKRKTPPEGQLKLMNVMMGFVRMIEDPIKFPLGISLISVARVPLSE